MRTTSAPTPRAPGLFVLSRQVEVQIGRMDDSSQATVATQPVATGSEDAPSRLTLYKAVFENYKSYCGRVEVGPFDKSMTCVIGPNGSGKSNVFDGTLFVFGFQAKDMRQDNMLGLIHKSSKYPNLQSAKVRHQTPAPAPLFARGTLALFGTLLPSAVVAT